MNTTHVGKIGRLPHALREHLNRRLQEGEKGRKLVAWLNALPEVQAVLAGEFAGRPINAQNLTDWRQGGYRDWLAQQEARELAERLGQKALAGVPEAAPPFTNTVATWLVCQYGVAARRVRTADEKKKWQLLREMCWDIVALRRGDLRAQRLDLDREWRTSRGTPQI